MLSVIILSVMEPRITTHWYSNKYTEIVIMTLDSHVKYGYSDCNLCRISLLNPLY
jgi:hypothetical protein